MLWFSTWLLLSWTSLPTWLLFPSTWLLFIMDFVTNLVTFNFDLVTFFSPNVNHEFLCLVIIHKRDIDIFVQCTSDAATNTSVWQQVYSIVKRNILRGIEVPALMSSIVSPLGNAYLDRGISARLSKMKMRIVGLHVQRIKVYSCLQELNQTGIRYFNLPMLLNSSSTRTLCRLRVKNHGSCHTDEADFPLHISIIYLVTEDLAADTACSVKQKMVVASRSLDRYIPNTSLVWCKTTAVGHHFCRVRTLRLSTHSSPIRFPCCHDKAC